MLAGSRLGFLGYILDIYIERARAESGSEKAMCVAREHLPETERVCALNLRRARRGGGDGEHDALGLVLVDARPVLEQDGQVAGDQRLSTHERARARWTSQSAAL